MSNRNRLLDSALRVLSLVVALSLAILLTPLAIRELSKNPQQRAEAAAQAEHETQQAEAMAQLCSSLNDVEGSASERCESARNRADLQAQQGMQAAAWTQAGLSALGLILLGWTLFYTRRAVEEAGDATKAASKGARAAIKANEAFAQASKRELRAYVGVAQAQVFDLIEGKNPYFKLRFVNFGSTPAYVTRSWCSLRGGAAPVLGPFDPDPGDASMSSSRFSLAPTVGQSLTYHHETTFTADMVRIVKDGLAEIVFYGAIHYRDAFGESHTTSFRHRIGGTYGVPADGSMSPLLHGNEAD